MRPAIVVDLAFGPKLQQFLHHAAQRMRIERRELAVGVIRKMARGLVQLDRGRYAACRPAGSRLQQLAVEEVLQLAADDGPLGQPEDQPGADHRVDGEQFQLLAQHAMVAAFGLFDLGEIGVQVLLAEPGGAVEPLQLLPLGVAFPIGPGHGEELEGPDRPGAGHVRAAAEIDELALPVERDLAMVGQAGFDVLDLQALAQVLAELQGLVAVHFDPLERLVFLDDPGHLGLDLGEILFGEPPLGLEIVVEAVLDRGPEGQLHAVEQPHHRPGHDVGAGVPHDVQGLGVAAGDQPQGDLAFFGQEGVGADELAIDLGGQGGLGQARADFGGNIDGADAAGIFQDFAVGQIDFEHVPR